MILRQKRRRNETSIDAHLDGNAWGSLDIPDPGKDVELRYLERDREVRLRTAVNRLSPVLRDVLEIRLSSDGSIKEIAQEAGISVAAAKSRLIRAEDKHLEDISTNEMLNQSFEMTLLPPAIARSSSLGAPVAVCAIFAFILAGPTYDLTTRYRIHPAYTLNVLLFIIAGPPARIAFASTPAWHHSVQWMISRY